MVASMTSSSRELRITLALLAVRKSQWPFERLARELGVDVSLVKFRQRPVHDHPNRPQRMVLRNPLLRGEVTEHARRPYLRTTHPIGLPSPDPQTLCQRLFQQPPIA